MGVVHRLPAAKAPRGAPSEVDGPRTQEARTYAENVPRGFVPATGTLHHYRPVPVTPTVRLETGAEEGDTVISMHYDLWSLQIAGLPTNIGHCRLQIAGLPCAGFVDGLKVTAGQQVFDTSVIFTVKATGLSEAVGFSDLPNHKAILETTLRKHVTLLEGDVITVYYGELQYRLRVLELKPSSSVSILETDIEVDIEGFDSVWDNENEQHVLIPLAESGIVEEGKFKYYKFSIEETLSEKVSTGLMNIEVKIEADTSDGDTNIYVSRHPLVFPTQHRHEWS
ncbi:Methylcrotonoyl-CoA carboxylase subunit alpha, mitochondrial [Ananas comosus]|uniref:Methylcrotonoyl-CoA carboxylase subunit alpha, mitochondrial n=1 Tax=Ananas comosus TaxID=4615 RepID=A0A199UE41_ANACO|nr:Methylcrotonoyl-CoA carboxylase subunit alpha, mitochondrial [Ananas comosus]